MSAARTVALEALKMTRLQYDSYPYSVKLIDEAIAALEAETGEPVAWIKPSDLVALEDQRRNKADCSLLAVSVVSKRGWSETSPLYAAPGAPA